MEERRTAGKNMVFLNLALHRPRNLQGVLSVQTRNHVRSRRRYSSAWYRIGLVRRDSVKGIHEVVMRNQWSLMGQGKSDEHPTLRR
ncbi:hypothetical protein Taro_010155 [Colocasia esculenta]|uniref:Uncharacterized protein n=1 Tax=Colocasia esculenta TaxID=4460 RepID=A0A843U2H5_COLES|nr:hypothetical protein [Colocasia esculenta]